MMIEKIDFEKFPELNEFFKEKVGLSVYSLILTEDNEYFLYWRNVCSCCYGNSKSFYYILDEKGNILRQEDETFYLNKKPKKIFKFNIPERLKSNYLKIKY